MGISILLKRNELCGTSPPHVLGLQAYFKDYMQALLRVTAFTVSVRGFSVRGLGGAHSSLKRKSQPEHSSASQPSNVFSLRLLCPTETESQGSGKRAFRGERCKDAKGHRV